jgi:hypothetical protein
MRYSLGRDEMERRITASSQRCALWDCILAEWEHVDPTDSNKMLNPVLENEEVKRA